MSDVYKCTIYMTPEQWAALADWSHSPHAQRRWLHMSTEHGKREELKELEATLRTQLAPWGIEAELMWR